MRGLFKVWRKPPPIFAVPTTAGTGSETTIAAVISNPETHEKFIIIDFKLVPQVAVLDSELMRGLPPDITAATGMDALTHAVEAYIGLHGTRFRNEKAEKAVKIIFDDLEAVYQDGSDLTRRENMSLASFYAGVAFTRASVGYVHAVAHNLGGALRCPAWSGQCRHFTLCSGNFPQGCRRKNWPVWPLPVASDRLMKPVKHFPDDLSRK